jgi:hypothetical protein
MVALLLSGNAVFDLKAGLGLRQGWPSCPSWSLGERGGVVVLPDP